MTDPSSQRATAQVCGSCGTPGTGRFCGECGASLGAVQCGRCGAAPPAGARYCTSCGARMGAGSQTSGQRTGVTPPALLKSSTLAWITAGILGLSLFLVVGLPALGGGGAISPAQPPQIQPGAGQPPDLSSMTPREAADRLFNRIVQAQEAGDSVEMVTFLPMAIAAYERAEPLDADGGFHLSLLNRLALQAQPALQIAESVLATEPNHLLNLHAAAEAALLLGDERRSREYFTRFTDSYESERARGLADYQIHAQLLPRMLEDAEGYLSGNR